MLGEEQARFHHSLRAGYDQARLCDIQCWLDELIREETGKWK